MPMGSSMGHVRNLDLSDLFLDIYHFYTKALLSPKNKIPKFIYRVKGGHIAISKNKEFFKSVEGNIFFCNRALGIQEVEI